MEISKQESPGAEARALVTGGGGRRALAALALAQQVDDDGLMARIDCICWFIETENTQPNVTRRGWRFIEGALKAKVMRKFSLCRGP